MVVALDRRDDGLLTMTEAAELAGVHRNTIRAWCASGRLASVRASPRGERRVRRADVERLIAARTERAAAVAREGDRARGAPGQPLRVVPDPAVRTDALRRIAAEVSGAPDLPTLFENVLDDAATLFNVDRAGLWLYDPAAARPFTLAVERQVPGDILAVVAALARDEDAAGVRALRSRSVIVHDVRVAFTAAALHVAYERAGIQSVCFIPIVFRDEPLGLLVLYHDQPYDWSADEMELARSFADGMAIAIGNARLSASAAQLARRLHAIQELAIRLNRIQDVRGIGEAIVAEAGRLIDFDTVRVYRVDQATGTCEPIAFQGRFLGLEDPTAEVLRVPIGTGLTGWVAEHNEALRSGDAARDPRGLIVGSATTPESMLIVPMSFEDRVYGVIVVSQLGADRFDADDETTLSIFAGYAAQALVNAEALDQVRRQRAELAHQLASQRRLLDVNERLLSTLDPQAVLELIADSLKTVVAYDSLTIYRVDRAAAVRRAVVARDRYADLILQHEGPIDAGITGWCIQHGEAVLSNDAHLDPRSIQIPGTPEEPESMIVVPLQVRGEVIGTLNVARIGGREAHFSENEFELTKLFAGQASIALQNAEVHGEVRVRADHDALTGLRNHGAFQRELGEAVAAGEPFAVLMMDLDGFKVFNDTFGHPAGDALLAEVAQALGEAVRDGDRLYRYGGDEFAVVLPGAGPVQAHEIGERIRRAVAALGAPARSGDGPPVTISVGVACHPDDGRTKDALVGAADQALYLAKPSSRVNDGALAARDGYLHALDETAIALMERLDWKTLLETVMTRAAHLLGTPHGYIYLLDEASGDLVCHVGTGVFEAYLGYHLAPDEGVGGRVLRTGEPFAVDDYDAWPGRAARMPLATFGSVVGVPLTSGGMVTGVIGLASGDVERQFGSQEIAALGRFAQLASIALDNARLAEAAHRGAMYDPITGLPNRELLAERLAATLTWSRPEPPDPIAVILLDLDRFKVVNESLGHAVGDRLLADVARRLEATLRPGDTVARFGGDEFGIILDPITDPAEARRVADRIGGELEAPFELLGREWFISGSMGIAVGLPGASQPDDLLREAEIALVRAKADGNLRHAVFEPAMSDATRERVELEVDLRRALERDELRLHYQPIVDLATERIVAVEALVRWEHPRRGLITPEAFIPLAEETELILPLGRWVLESACRQATAWQDAVPAKGLKVSVNLSAREFGQPDLPRRLGEILAETGLPADRLELEITESVAMDQSETGAATLRALRDLGVSIVLDDFGTGYSSLSYLRHLPLDRLKVDRSFVTGLGSDRGNEPIVGAIVSLAHGLGMGVVAEGIETRAEAERLVALGCDLGQGYLWARPMPAEEVERRLRGHRVV
jgi:diguanylate cyclase (GGDEF)-like protein/excisionase family DNA binding protein